MNDAAMSQGLLIDAVTDHAIFMLDAGGVVQNWNKGAERLKGYRAGDILGQHFSLLYTNEDRRSGLPDRALALSERDGSFEGEGWRLRKDGSRFWANVVIDPIRDPSGKLIGFVKVTRDLTERKLAFDAVRESEEQFRLLVEAVADHAIHRLDLQGRITSWNKGAQTLKGYRPHDIVGRHFSVFYTQEDRQRGEPERGLDTALREGKFESQAWRVRQDGSTFWADIAIHPMRDERGAVIGFVKVTRHIAHSRTAEVALHAIPGLLAYWDNDLRCKFASNRYIEWFGMRPDEIIRMHIKNVIGEDLFNKNEVYIYGAISGRIQTFERAIKKADGTVGYTLVNYIPDIVMDKVAGFVAHVSDVTPLKETESRLRIEIAERKASQHLLNENREALQKAQRIGQIGSWEWLAPTDVTTWSLELYHIFGLDPANAPPTFAEHPKLYAEESWVQLQGAVALALKTGAPYTLELQFIRLSGEQGWIEGRGEPVYNEVGTITGLRGTVQNITKRKQAEIALRKTQDLLERTGAVAGVGGWEVDLSDGVITWSDQTCRLHDLEPGYRPTLEKALDFYAPGSRPVIENAVRGGVERGLAWDLELELVSAKGRPFWARATGAPEFKDGKVVRLVGAFQDISARRAVEKEVRGSEARYRMLADATSDVITQLDLDLVRSYVSPACRATLGYEPEELLGITPSVLIHPEDASQVRTVMELLAAGAVPGDKSTVTNRMRHKEGHWVWLEAGINLVRDPESGAPQSLICSLRDVTERQRAARHLERAKAIAENAARIKADFVANMSHELRTPLTGILGVHDLLKADPNLNARHRRYLDIAYQAGRSLLSIVNDVLDFSKIEAGQLSIERIPFDLDEIVTACRDFASAEARKKSLEIDLHLAVRGIKLVGDPNRLRQIMLNLLTNAVKFTQEGGVTLDVRYDTSAARLRVEVSDTGIGIAEDKIPLLFGRFSQADASITRRYGGTGLGLAICKRLIELMGGDIGMTSEPGLGTTVWFELPHSLSPSDPQERPHPDRYPAQRARRVLLAEDNLVNQEMIVAMIESCGHKVTAVDDGVAAVEAAQADAFDIILMDMQMPVLDGLSAAHAIRGAEKAQGRPAIPIIGLTANALADDIKRCREAGMDAHVAKPIEWTELFTTMDRLTLKPSGEMIAAVLEPEKLTDLARYIGRERLNRMLERFVVEVEQRLNALGSSTVAELATTMHMLTSMAGQFGFMEFSNLCAEIDAEARQGAGLNRLPDLTAAGARAVAAAKSSIGAE